MKIIVNHKPEFKICLPKDSAALTEAAGILNDYFNKMSGCEMEITNEVCGCCLKNKLVLDLAPFKIPLPDCDDLGDEGFLIAENNGTLYIYATKRDGIVFAVYAFLEEYCGCRWLTSTDDFIPHKCCIDIPENIFNKQKPLLDYREVYYRDAWNPVYADKQKLNGQLTIVNGKKTVEGHKNWGFWCHSFFTLIPPKDYFETHPEYYSLIDGNRVNNGQLCCTNDEMIGEAIKNLKTHMDKKPEAKYWSVSQNDTASPCQCEKCRKLDEEAGSHIGSIMYFINKVAEAFPDKIISTLAYWYSRTAPKKLEMRDNVHIMLCNIECLRDKPIAQHPQCESFVSDIKTWAKYCGNIFLWDYDIQFSNLISPFPNFHVLGPNMRFFYEENVRSIFNQSNRETRGDFWALRAYMLSKLSWNPYCDIEKHKSEFISAYYGKAAPFINEYIDTMRKELEKNGEPLGIFGQPQDEKFLSKECCENYMAILDDAVNAADTPELKLRAEEVMLGLVYAILKAKHYDDDEQKQEYKAFFRRVADEIGLEKVEEWTQTVDMFLEAV